MVHVYELDRAQEVFFRLHDVFPLNAIWRNVKPANQVVGALLFRSSSGK